MENMYSFHIPRKNAVSISFNYSSWNNPAIPGFQHLWLNKSSANRRNAVFFVNYRFIICCICCMIAVTFLFAMAVIQWNSFITKMMEYQRAARDRQIERAKKLPALKDPEENKKGPNDIRRFMKRVSNDIDYIALYKGSKALDALTRLTMLPLDRHHYRTKDLNRMIKNFWVRKYIQQF